jgi:hypothetical protein
VKTAHAQALSAAVSAARRASTPATRVR